MIEILFTRNDFIFEYYTELIAFTAIVLPKRLHEIREITLNLNYPEGGDGLLRSVYSISLLKNLRKFTIAFNVRSPSYRYYPTGNTFLPLVFKDLLRLNTSQLRIFLYFALNDPTDIDKNNQWQIYEQWPLQELIPLPRTLDERRAREGDGIKWESYLGSLA